MAGASRTYWMRMFEVRPIALVLSLLGALDAPASRPAAVEVTAARLDVFDEPDESSFATGRLRRGDRVIVRAEEPDGWLAIDPPPGSFAWIEQSAIVAARREGWARVVALRAPVRSGVPGARLPGQPRSVLDRGATVQLVDRSPLLLGRGPGARTWRAIEPPPGAVRYIRNRGVRRVAPAQARAPSATTLFSSAIPRRTPSTVPGEGPASATTRALFVPESAPAGLPPELASELAAIEAEHRAVLRAPVEQWRLESVRRRYQILLDRAASPEAHAAIRARLERAARHEDAARTARRFADLLDRSRSRDRAFARLQAQRARAARPPARPYEAEGLIQPSSRTVDGHKVFSLIGPEGTTLAYLDVPAGLDAEPFAARRVGVRGAVHFDEDLRAPLISVRDLVPLDQDR
jgi:hypothetical protein